MSLCVGYLDWFMLYGNMLVYNCKGDIYQKKTYLYTSDYNNEFNFKSIESDN